MFLCEAQKYQSLISGINRSTKTLAANAGGRGFESHGGQNSFHNLLYLIEWNVKNYFVKLI